MRAVVYEAFRQAPTVETVPDPEPPPRRGRPRRGERALPLGLARLDGPRPRHPPLPARPGPRAGRGRRGGRRRRAALAGRAARDRAVRVRVRRPASSAAPGRGRSATARPSRASRTGARSPSSSRSTGPTSTSSACRTRSTRWRRPASAAASRPPTARCSQVGRAQPGEWVAVHGCGGVGLSAVMIAAAAGARVVAVDVSEAALDAARDGRRRASPSPPARTCASSPAAAPTSASTRSAARRRAPRRSPACASAAATSRSGCCPIRRASRWTS